MTSKNWFKGVLAGLAATAVLSALMAMKQGMGLMPALDPVGMLTSMAGASTPAIGWVMHVMIGVVLWGTLFAWLAPFLPGGAYWLKGVAFGVGAWIVMMIAVMPMAGASLFGLALGVMAPMATLALHLVYGAVLGGVYGLERPESGHLLQVSH
jgi:hypothetical protein